MITFYHDRKTITAEQFMCSAAWCE